jgi:rhizosphere induced protein
VDLYDPSHLLIIYMLLDFSGDGEVKYSLKCINQSVVPWYFYIYQRTPNQADNNIYSLVWMTSPYKLTPQSYIAFKWSVDYSFFWFDTGKIQPGAVPTAGGIQPASLPSANSVSFNIQNDAPQFSTPVKDASPNQFSILQGANIPNAAFSTGIGTSGFGTLIQQAYMNTGQTFGTNSVFWVAAKMDYVQPTQILSQNDSLNSASFAFPLNIYTLTATLKQDNTWSVQ